MKQKYLDPLDKFKQKKEEIVFRKESKKLFELIPIEKKEGGWLTERGSTANFDPHGNINIQTSKAKQQSSAKKE